MHTVIIKGEDALNYAAHHRGTPIHELDHQGHDHTVSLEEARRAADEDPATVWVEIQTHINSAD